MAKAIKETTAGRITNVKIRMYCLGTGDCFILKFYNGASEKFTMMIDCGSCQGTPKEFTPYIEDLAGYINNHIDLLVVTHEHNDHVNGFAKCESIFKDKKFTISEAWFAWTENPDDPDDRAKEIQKKRQKMKKALTSGIAELRAKANAFELSVSDDYFKVDIQKSHMAMLNGLDTLAEINLTDEGGDGGKPLPGMVKIKAILEEKKTKIRYLNPGDTVTLTKLTGLKFHVLGPPFEREFVFKDGKEGTDVYKKNLGFSESALAANAFLNITNTDIRDKDIPFGEEYIVNETKPSIISSITSSRDLLKADSSSLIGIYYDQTKSWRKIDMDWLNSAGALALRLNSHINNTSLALAIEDVKSQKVILLPGDAEYGSWESWHTIAKWKNKGAGGKHFTEDLLNRTVFYKVGHHLSYNGTALEKGINMMESTEFAAMATLDRHRISKGWKSTMPNTLLMAELIKKSGGKFFIMDEFEIKKGPSKTFDTASLGKNVYEEKTFEDNKNIIFKQYTIRL